MAPRSLLLPALLLATAASAQPAAPPPAAPPAAEPAPAPVPGEVRVELRTALGLVVVAVDTVHAPVTAANFLRYVDERRLDGTSFYRAVRVAPGAGLVQGGARNNPKRLLPPIAHEPTSTTGLSHRSGTISMARLAPGSATADFFILVGDFPSYDADPTQPGDNAGFAAFGHVVAGMSVVEQLLALPTAADGPPGMAGQMIAAPVPIITARRMAAGGPPPR